MLSSKTKASEWAAAEFKWTKADALRAFERTDFPADEMVLMNAMVRFAGPELLNRQRLQGAQKTQVTIKKKEVKAAEERLVQTVQQYEDQIRSDRSSFTVLIKTLYNIANRFGYKDPWIESLIVAYDKYVDEDDASQKAA
ncbi:MAG: hypothetical protein MH252_08365 [Thermosynechococcaceae cyanobacterium MS004]|nr:hypothetical protein [Thermosynechococcaceae cyanobacterium MS004]